MRTLSATFALDHQGRSIVTVSGFPGQEADLTPDELRSMARCLVLAATDAESGVGEVARKLGREMTYEF